MIGTSPAGICPRRTISRRMTPLGCADPSPCPCCTAEFPMPPHAGDICPVCGWEIDPEAETAPEQPSEANHSLSLSEAQMNFRAFGICDPSLRWNE